MMQRDSSRVNSLEDAIALAAAFHKGQVDKAGQPYILHPLRVMLKLDGEKQRIVAVLHDVVEDTDCDLDRIRRHFGDEIAEAVDALSRRNGESYTAFIERCGQNDIARSVKWADLTDNMDLSRLPAVTLADRKRYDKYRAAAYRLTDIAAGKASASFAQAGVTEGGDSTQIEAPGAEGE